EWRENVVKEYDLISLRDFLITTIKENPEIDSVDTTKSKVGDKWIVADRIMFCGDWTLHIDSNSTDNFTMSWIFERNFSEDGTGPFKEIEFRCTRNTLKEFALVSASTEE